MKPALRWMLAGLSGMSLAGCVYYPDYGYVRGDGYGSTGSVYYETTPYPDGYYGGYYGPAYYGPYGYSPWSGYYSIGIGVHHGHDGHHGHGWGGHDRPHDARPAHRAGPEVQSRRRR